MIEEEQIDVEEQQQDQSDDGGKKKKSGGQAADFLSKVGKETTVQSTGMADQFLSTVKKKEIVPASTNGSNVPADGESTGTTSTTNNAVTNAMEAFSKKGNYKKGELLYNFKQDEEIVSRINNGNVTGNDLKVLKKKNPEKYKALTENISSDYDDEFLKTPTASGIIAEKINKSQKEVNLIASKNYDAIYNNNLDEIITHTAAPVNEYLSTLDVPFQITPTTDIEESKKQYQFLVDADRKNQEQYNKDKIVTKVTAVQGTLAGTPVSNTTEFDVSKMSYAQIDAWKDQDPVLYGKLVDAKNKTIDQDKISSVIHTALTPLQTQLGNNLVRGVKNINIKDIDKDYVRDIGEQIYKIQDPDNYELFKKAGGYDNTKPESQQSYDSDLDKVNKEIMSNGYAALKPDIAANGTIGEYQNIYDNLSYLDYKFATPLVEETKHMMAARLKLDGITPSKASDEEKDKVALTLPLENQQVWFNKTKGTSSELLPDTGFGYSFGKSFARTGTNILQSGSVASPLSWATLFLGVPDDKENAKEILRNQMKSDVIGENPGTLPLYNELKEKQTNGTINQTELNTLNYLASFNDVRSSWDRIVDGNANMVGMISAVTIDAIPTIGGSALSSNIVRERNIDIAEDVVTKGAESVPILQRSTAEKIIPTDTEGIVNFLKNKNEMFVIMHHDNTVKAMELFPDDDTKKAWYTGITDVVSVALPNILPTHKLGKLFTTEAKDIVSEVVNKISAENLDKAVIDNMMKETASKIISKAGTFLVGTEKTAAEASLTMSLMTLGNNVTQAILKPDSISGNDISNNFVQTLSSTFMDSQLIGLIGGKSAVQKRYGQVGTDAIYDATNNRNSINAVRYSIFQQQKNGQLTDAQANEKVSLLETGAQLRPAVNDLQIQENLSPTQAKRVYINLLNERILKNQILKLKEAGESESLIAPKEKRIQELNDLNAKIIGKEVFVNDKYDIVDKNEKEVSDKFIVDNNVVTETEFNDIISKGQTEVDKYDIAYVGNNEKIHEQLKSFGGTTDGEKTISPKGREVVLKEGIGELYDRLDGKAPAHYLDPLNKEGSINELTHQALTAPQGLKYDLGEPLLLELIARNSVEDINKSIDDWTKVATKEGVTPSELNDADRHIKLLEKGLEEKGKIHEESNPIKPTVESAVIEINGKTYEGKNHAEAILKAKEAGEDISKVNRQAEGQFKLSDGTVIDRKEAKDRFGQNKAELLIEQDEASKKADEDYTAPTVSSEVENEKQSKAKDAVKGTKVSDDKGEPIVVYHGTNHEFENFDRELSGSKNFLAESAYEGTFFAGSPETSKAYTGMNNSDVIGMNIGGSKILEKANEKYKKELDDINEKINEVIHERKKVFDDIFDSELGKELKEKLGFNDEQMHSLKISHPKWQQWYEEAHEINEKNGNNEKLKAVKQKMFNEIEEEFIKEKGLKPRIMKAYLDFKNPYIFDYEGQGSDAEGLTTHIKRAKKNGHDGVIFKNLADGGEKDNIYVAFNSDQIKPFGALDRNGNEIKSESKPIQNEEAKANEVPIGTEKKVITETEPIKALEETAAGTGGKEPPKEEPPVGDKKQEPLGNKALAVKLVNAKGTPDAAKVGIEAEGLEYAPQSHREAQDLAKSIVDELGIDDAVLQAQAGKFGGDVNTLVQTIALEKLAVLEDVEVDAGKKLDHALKYAEIGIALDKSLRKQGRSISAIGHFYKKSPLGIQLIENAKRKEDFERWAKPKEQSWKEVFTEMMKDPEFETLFKEEVQGQIKKERADVRAERKEKVHKDIDETIDKWIKKLTPDSTKGAQTKGGSAESVLKSVGAAMKKAYDAGEAISEVIKTAIETISEKLGITDWDKDGFTKEWESKFGNDSSYKESSTRHQKRIDDLNKELQRIKERRSKEKKEVKESTREIPKEEQYILDAIEKEQSTWDAEKDMARQVASDYQKLETERNRQLKRVGELNEQIDILRNGELPQGKKLEPKIDTPEIEALKSEKDALERSVRESIAHEKKLTELEKELQRLKDRKEKEPKPESKRTVTEDERLLRDEIEAERKAWDIEKNVVRLHEELERVKARAKKVTEPKEKRELTIWEKELTNSINHEKELWRKEVEPERKVRQALKAAQKSLTEYERRIAEKDISKKESDTVETPELKSLREKRDAKRKEYEEMKKGMLQPERDAEMMRRRMEKFISRLKGLTEKQKEQLIQRTFKKIVEEGALEYPELRKMISDVTGRGDMTAAEAQKLRELVRDTNAVDETGIKARTERTPEARAAFREAEIKAGKASKELNTLLYNRPNITKRLTSLMQLNTLGIPALVNNPIYNVWNQITLRTPIGFIKTLLDKGIYYGAKAIGKEVLPETNILSLQVQKEFFKKLGLGTKESVGQFVTGLNRQDYIQKEVQGNQIRPVTAVMDLWDYYKGDKNLTKTQIIDKIIQASPPGVTAEIIARTLNLGDKPQRFAAEGAQAAAFAKSLGLKDIDYDLFIDFPREEAYRAFKQKGLSDAEAAKRADYIKDIIVKEGERSTFQQDNFLNNIISRTFGGKDSGIGGLAKATIVSPYIKIPSNAYWSYYNIVNPEVAMLQSMIYAGKAFVKTKGASYWFDRTNSSAAKDLHEAKYWLAHAAVGMATRAVVVSLVSAGIFRSGNTGDDTKKERESEAFYEQQGSINLSKLSAWLKGEDPSKVKNGLVVQNRWFGHWGTVGNTIARKYEDMTPEQKANQGEFWDAAIGNMELYALQDFEQGIFGNTSTLLNSLNQGIKTGSVGNGIQSWGVNTLNMFANIVHPAAMAQLSRAQLPYYTKRKADSFLGELKNSMLERSSVIRYLSGQYPPSKVGIWGDRLDKKDNVIMRLFGISRANDDNFAQPIYEDYKKTNNTKFFPPAVMPTITDNGVKRKLNTADAAKFEEMVGHQRKELVAPYINDMARFEGSKKVYSQLDEDEKLDKLDILYDEGYKNAKYLFLQEHPEYQSPEKTKTEAKEDKKDSKANEQFRKSLKKKSPINN